MPNYSGIWTEQAVMQAVGAGNWPGNPGAPTIGTATAGDASASVTFTAPTNNGGSAITSYTVTSSPGSLTGTGASSPVTVSGLTNGTAYTFTVTATNGTGTGPASAASNSVTPAAPVYVEEVFSTYLYTGTGVARTITNGINISGNGGFVWIKGRNAAEPHVGVDTVRGASNALRQNSDAASINDAGRVSAFTTSGFTVGTDGETNGTGTTYASWTFREQAKFFDVVTWTGNGANRTIAHNLGSVPGCIIVKRTNTTSNWAVYHRSLTNVQYLDLNNNNDVSNSTFFWNSTTPTSTVFSLGNDDVVNASGSTYVAYVFAHNAGGFGLTGTDNVISCGSVVNTGNPQVTLGYEPQWVLFKTSDSFSSWYIVDNMRGLPVGGDQAVLLSNSTAAEVTNSNYININATGFTTNSSLLAGTNIVYIAIRRGPMKVPTSGTSVFDSNYGNNLAGAGTIINSNMLVDMYIQKGHTSGTPGYTQDRLRGPKQILQTSGTDVEFTTGDWLLDQNTGVGYSSARDATDRIGWMFKRAPGFFDEVICTQTGSAQNVNHNLGVAPELLILKDRTSAVSWQVGTQFTSTTWNNLILNTTDAGSVGAYNNYINAQPTASVFRLGSSLGSVNDSFVAYLFATCAGVSKVGSYTGTGAAQTINCGFAAGSRFVMIKRTDSTGDWYVWDSTRGIIPSSDPYLLLNNQAAQVTGTDYIDTSATGFDITSTAPAGINANGGSYIFLAIA